MSVRVNDGSPEMPEELDLAQSALTEHGMVKRRDTLDGNLRARGNVNSRPVVSSPRRVLGSHYDSVRALANDLMDLVVFRYVERDVRRSHRPRLI